jgi:hypothetical protein
VTVDLAIGPSPNGLTGPNSRCAVGRSIRETCVTGVIGGSSDWQPFSWTACDDLLEPQAREVIHADGCLFALH